MKNNKSLLNIISFILLVSLTAIMFFNFMQNPFAIKKINYTEFKELIKKNKIKNLDIEPIDVQIISITGELKEKSENKENIKFETIVSRDSEFYKKTIDNKEIEKVDFKETREPSVLLSILSSILPLILVSMLFFYFFSKMQGGKGNNPFDFTKSKSRIQIGGKIKFDDVAGYKEEKQELSELVDFLKNPKKYEEIGAKIPKGALLIGPPGTGKTMLAKATAGEAGVPFHSISGSEFLEMFVGVGAARVRDTFKKAKESAPAIIFIDEIDAIGRQRGAGIGGGNDEREQTLNQILVEMDGFKSNKGLIVIAATNRPDILDPALIRPGRFDRKITVNLPSIQDREKILEIHAKDKKLSEDIDLNHIAKSSPGFSGSDLANLLNEAALVATRRSSKKIENQDLEEALDRVIAGPSKESKDRIKEDNKVVAYHEAGHALIGALLNQSEFVQKVTITPRGMAGGYAIMIPKKEKMIKSKLDLEGQIVGLLGGRISEEIMFGKQEITTGASNDIEKATKIARSMVTEYGMSSLGPIQYEKDQGDVFLGRDYSKVSMHSEQTNLKIDEEIRKIIDKSYKKGKEFLNKNKKTLIKLAESLLEKESLNAKEIEEIVFSKKL